MIEGGVYDPQPFGLPVHIISMSNSTRIQITEKAWRNRFRDVHIELAFDGAPLSPNDIRISPSLFRRRHFNFQENPFAYKHNSTFLSSSSAIGCYLSHQGLWKKALHTGQSMIIVEEDTLPDESITASDILDQCTEDVVVLMHGGRMFGRRRLLKNSKGYFGLNAYFITKSGAQVLLQTSLPIDMHVDLYIHTISIREDTNWLMANMKYKTIGKSSLNHSTFHNILKLSSIALVFIALVLVTLNHVSKLRYDNRRLSVCCKEPTTRPAL